MSSQAARQQEKLSFRTLVLSLKRQNLSWTALKIANFFEQLENLPNLNQHGLMNKINYILKRRSIDDRKRSGGSRTTTTTTTAYRNTILQELQMKNKAIIRSVSGKLRQNGWKTSPSSIYRTAISLGLKWFKKNLNRIYSIPFLSQRGQHKFVSTDGYLQPGTYVILPFLFNPINKQMDNTEFNIAVHSSRAIDLERIKIPLKIEREFLIKLCLFHGEQVQTRLDHHHHHQQQTDDGIKIYELKKYWDGLILLVENRNYHKYLHFHFRCTLSQNAFISRHDSHHQLFDVIPPMHRQIIVTIARKNASHSFTIGHDFQYHLSSQQFIKNSRFSKEKHSPKIDESNSGNDIHLPQSISTTNNNVSATISKNIF